MRVRVPDRRRHPAGPERRLHPVRPVHRRLRRRDGQDRPADAPDRLRHRPQHRSGTRRGLRREYRFVRVRTLLYVAIIALVGGVMTFALGHAHRAVAQRPARSQPGVRASFRWRDPQRLHGAHQPTSAPDAREFTLSISGLAGSLVDVVQTRADGRFMRRGRPGPDARDPRAGDGLRGPSAIRPRRSTSISTTSASGERASASDYFRAPEENDNDAPTRMPARAADRGRIGADLPDRVLRRRSRS